MPINFVPLVLLVSYFKTVLSHVTPKFKEIASLTLVAVTGTHILSPNFAFCLGKLKVVDEQLVKSKVKFPSQL